MRTRAAILAALVAALPGLGCDRAEPRAPAPAPAPGATPALPAPGETRVERRGDRYDVAASDAAPLDALTELSMRAGFRVERGGEPPPAPRRTVWLHDVSLERAVAAILAGVPHAVHHEFADGDLDPARPFEGRSVVLARVSVGDPGGVAGAPEGVAGAPGEPSGRSDRAARSTREPRDPRPRKERPPDDAPGAEARAAAEAARDEAVARDAEDPDADVRLDAIERMDPDAGDRAQLARMLRGDASPEVRAAAAEQLAEGDPFEATPVLLNALADPDPTVVEASVQALEDVYDEAPDPRIRESIAVLREHRDADVRAAVEDFEAWTEE